MIYTHYSFMLLLMLMAKFNLSKLILLILFNYQSPPTFFLESKIRAIRLSSYPLVF